MPYLDWKLDDESYIELEMPLGRITLNGETGFIEDDNLMLDTFLEALAKGLSKIQQMNEVNIDTIDEPFDLIIRRVSDGIEISYGKQITVVKEEALLVKELIIVIRDFLEKMDHASKLQQREASAYLFLRDFLITSGS